MRASLLWSVLGFATSFTASASAAPLANTATWITPLPGVNWHPAEHYIEGSLDVSVVADIASVVLHDFGHAWRLRIDAQGQVLSREFNANAQVVNTRTRALMPGDLTRLASEFSPLDFGPGKCWLQGNASNLDFLWRREFTGLSCINVVPQVDGGMVTEIDGAIISLNAQGEIRWQRNWTELGEVAHVHVMKLVMTASGRVLVIARGAFNGVSRKVLWVLDDLSGQALALHDRPIGEEHVLAVRERADQSIEWIGAHYQSDSAQARISHWSADGDFIESRPLSAFRYLHHAMAHPNGFILFGDAATDAGEIRYFDGANLRWHFTLPESAFGYGYVGVEHEGSLALPTYRKLLRLDSNGQQLQPIEISVADLVYAEDSSLWVLERHDLSYHDRFYTISRYTSGAATPSFSTSLNLPIRTMKVLNMQVDPTGDLHIAGALNADSALATSHRLQIQKVDEAGQVSMLIDRQWPDFRVDAIQPLESGWLVYSTHQMEFPSLSQRSMLRGLDAQGQQVWAWELPQYSTVICNNADRCALRFRRNSQYVVQRIDAGGQVLSEFTESTASHTQLQSEPGRLIGINSDGTNASLLDLSVHPPQVLARAPVTAQTTYRVLQDRLLSLSTAGLSSHSLDQVLWTRADLAGAQLFTTNGRLHVSLQPVSGPVQVLQLNPDTGSTLSAVVLPTDILAVQNIDAAADNEQWVHTTSTSGPAVLALTPGAPVQRFSAPLNIQGIRAVPGALFTLSSTGYSIGDVRLEVARFDMPLFRDGFETP